MKTLVIGSAGLQVTVPINDFPLHYKSIYFKDDLVKIDIAGVGYSAIKILSIFKNDVTFLTSFGNDKYSEIIRQDIRDMGIKCFYDIKDKESLVSVVLYDDEGKRSILREGRSDYRYVMSPSTYSSLGDDYDVCIATLTNFAREILPILKSKNIDIVTDMQTVDNLSSEYGKEFMEYSDIIFFSNDHFNGDINELLNELYNKYKYKIIGVGLGNEGCLLFVEGNLYRYDAQVVKAVNTVGAGDALFNSFISFLYNNDHFDDAIRKAIIFVSEKIKHHTASKGFISLEEVNRRYRKL